MQAAGISTRTEREFDRAYARRSAIHARNARKRKMRITERILALLVVLAVLILATVLVLALTAKRADAVSAPTYKYYTTVEVDPGDSLWSVAESHMTDGYDSPYALIDEIMDINGLSSQTLKAGQKIVVPYYSTEYKS